MRARKTAFLRIIFISNQTPFLDVLSSKGVPSGGLPQHRKAALRNDIKYFVRKIIFSLIALSKSQNFDEMIIALKTARI